MTTWPDWRKMIDLRERRNIRNMKPYTIQSQYSASKRMLTLARGFQYRLEPTADAKLFYDKMFNIMTAEGEGLDNWGRILAIGRAIEDNSVSITLTDEYYRLLLLYKALANISRSDAESLNHLLATLMATGVGGFTAAAYVLEVDTMVIRWVFEDFLNETQLAVFKVAGTLARGGGVGWELYAVNPNQVFGFDGSGLQPFNQAPFAPDAALVDGS
ncbi:MAG: DUF2612 domain-containing protein [Candidatus Adiutrix sp.]|jgi:hypothetical protein|nr:DUF2612 domain-containing protein [Candidatus Adiutrix sp.]